MPLLNYVIFNPTTEKTGLSIYNAETYDSAITVQQLVGNLIYYSNFGRYEPRIAKSWARPSPNLWQFELHDGFRCENGEEINGDSFRKSLLRSIRIQEKLGGSLVFRQLKGFSEFISGKSDLLGLRASKNTISFEFTTPIRDGLLEALSFAPFGYLCEENFNPDDTWKDEHKFVSSGPYRLTSIEIGKKVVIERRNDWNGQFASGAPDKVAITYLPPIELNLAENWIVNVSRNKPDNLANGLLHYPLVPEYLGLVALGGLKNGFFSKLENRLAFKERFEYRRSRDIPLSSELWTRADSFYPSQNPKIANLPTSPDSPKYVHKFSRPTSPIRIQGKPIGPNHKDSILLTLASEVLRESGIEFVYTNTDNTRSARSDPTVDIRMVGVSVGGEVNPWGIGVNFCSSLHLRLPDPSGRICKMVRDYDQNAISIDEASKTFLEAIEEDAAIFPLRHFGQHLYLTKSIDQESFGPSLSIMRFDQLRILQ